MVLYWEEDHQSKKDVQKHYQPQAKSQKMCYSLNSASSDGPGIQKSILEGELGHTSFSWHCCALAVSVPRYEDLGSLLCHTTQGFYLLPAAWPLSKTVIQSMLGL